MNKKCSKCKIVKDLSEFGNNKSEKDGKCHYCKKCNTERVKLFYKKHPCKRVLRDIKRRCNDKSYIQYKDWGGRGIKCLITLDELQELWKRDKADKMKIASIDRIDNDGDYIFENCRFIEKSLNTTLRNKLNRKYV